MTKLIVTLFCLFHFVIFGIKYKYDLEEVSFICLRLFGVDGMTRKEEEMMKKDIFLKLPPKTFYKRGSPSIKCLRYQ